MTTSRTTALSVSRRQLTLLTAAAGLVLTQPRIASGGATSGDAATPNATPDVTDTLGYPAMTVTISLAGLDLPKSIPGGLTHVTVVNVDVPEGEHMVWMRLPGDTTTDDVLADQAASTETSPVLQWWRDAQIVGGPDWAFPGRDAVGVVNFIPGTYVLINIFGSQSGFLEVSEPDASAVVETPSADLTVSMVDYAFQGIPDEIPAGRSILEVRTTGATFHEVAFLPVPAGTTEESIVEIFASDSPPLDFAPVGGVSIMTPGLTSWLVLDLVPGTYTAFCAAPDNWAGPAHVMLGMIKMFIVV